MKQNLESKIFLPQLLELRNWGLAVRSACIGGVTSKKEQAAGAALHGGDKGKRLGVSRNAALLVLTGPS